MTTRGLCIPASSVVRPPPFSFPVLPQHVSSSTAPGAQVNAAKASYLSPGERGSQMSTQNPPSSYPQLVGMENKDGEQTSIRKKTVIFSIISCHHRARYLHCLSQLCLNIWQIQLWNYSRRNAGRVFLFFLKNWEQVMRDMWGWPGKFYFGNMKGWSASPTSQSSK